MAYAIRTITVGVCERLELFGNTRSRSWAYHPNKYPHQKREVAKKRQSPTIREAITDNIVDIVEAFTEDKRVLNLAIKQFNGGIFTECAVSRFVQETMARLGLE